MDYVTLVATKATEGSIKNWLNYDQIPSTTILTEAQAEIYNFLRVREMILEVTKNLVQADTSFTLPDDYLEAKGLMITGTLKKVLKKKELMQLKESWEYDSSSARIQEKPSYFAADATTMQFDTAMDQSYAVVMTYYAIPAALAEGSNPTNFLTTKFPALLREACMFKAYQFLRNAQERQTHYALFKEQINLANVDSDREMSGVELNMYVE